MDIKQNESMYARADDTVLPLLHTDGQRVVADSLGSGHAAQNPSGSSNDLANQVKKCFFFFFFFLNKPFNLFKYSMHMPRFIWNNERQG